ncbi:phage tail length tape measure family protein [Rhizobium sp. CC1099]|uniref:phage tail length tape measure family protein n=1 Tax=Rhizobium sp. CC1099 TaxID=3039160 RepID=UPI0024B11F73|nr:phage tail length tape measure family protein [Rhizobium sp. CC1099]WFU88991.1 phage tail length tape measure family protein [Rhizobium sp. CC1099]
MADTTDDLIISISTDQATLRRSIQRIERDLSGLAGSVQKQFSAVGKSIDNSVSSTLQQRINATMGIGKAAAKEWTGALADQGKELERLRAKYSPLFATINQYKMAVADIKRAHAIGAISATEMASAISKERQAALASTAAIKGRNAALAATPAQRAGAGVGAFQTANIAAQFQDIAVTSAMGMNPLQIALQQGTQLSSVISTLGTGKGVVAGLAAAFGSLISPVSLVTIALVAGGAAAIQYFQSVANGGAESEEALKKEAELIQSVAQKWGDVLPELKRYADERQKLLDAKEQKDAAAAAANAQWEELRKTAGDTKIAFADVVTQLQAAGAETESISTLQRSFNELTNGIADGTANAEQARAVHEELASLAKDIGIPVISEFAKVFDTWAASIDGVRDASEKLKNSPIFNENFSKSRLPTLGTLGPVYSDSGTLLTDPNEIDRYLKRQEDNRNPTIDTGRGRPVPVPTPTAKPIQLGEEVDKKTETATTRAANAYRDLQKAADDRIGQIRQEIGLLGKYGTEADAARFALDLFQQSEDKGRSLSEQQRKEIEKKVELYKQYSETLAKAKLSQDLLMDMRFNSLSKEDQQITTTLRQYGLPEDLNSEQASQVRQSIRIEGAREELRSFFGDFKSALLNNGGDIGKAFGEAIQNALLNQASKLWDKVFDQLTNAILGGGSGQATSGGGGLGAIGGAIASALGGRPSGGSSGGASGAVDKAFSLLGSTESTSRGSINTFLKQGGVDIDAAQTAWCAAFVNSSLAQVGVEGSGSLTANSFLDWGSKIDPSKVLRGDVLVESRGLGANQAGGHVGFATGAMRSAGGVDQLQMLSGNLSNGVNTSWVDATQVQVRRATEAANALGKVADSAGSATQGLGTFGSGLGQLGSQLGGAQGGAGGWLSFLSGTIFSGSGQLAASGGIGLFADGGHVSGPGGPTDDSVPAMLSNGEFVINSRATRKHRQLLEAINTGRVARFATGGLVNSRSIGAPTAPPLSPRGRSASNDNANPGVLVVRIDGANGDDHVRTIVKQGVDEGLGQYNENQRRGGFGTMQTRFTSQKG